MATETLTDVSRETIDKLRTFADLAAKWTMRINLIAKSTVPDIWNRHILDSAQLYQYAPPFGAWVDIGSGGGFPGIVMAIMAAEKNVSATFTLIESDARKSTFLRTAARDLQLSVKVITARIETAEAQNADVLSARALGSLADLFPHAARHLKPEGTALFMKGRRHQEEIRALQPNWTYAMTEHPSMTDEQSRILSFKRISRAA